MPKEKYPSVLKMTIPESRGIDYTYDSNGRLSEMKFFRTERGKFILVKVHKLIYAN